MQVNGFSFGTRTWYEYLTAKGYWEAWYVGKSNIAGVGLHTKVRLPKGTCIGRVARTYALDHFIDWPIVRYCNHSPEPTLDIISVPDYDLGVVHMFGVAARDVEVGEELAGDYYSERCPSPNFKYPNDSRAYKKFFGWSPDFYALPKEEQEQQEPEPELRTTDAEGASASGGAAAASELADEL